MIGLDSTTNRQQYMYKKNMKKQSQCLKLTALHEVSMKVKFKQVRDILKKNTITCHVLIWEGKGMFVLTLI